MKENATTFFFYILEIFCLLNNSLGKPPNKKKPISDGCTILLRKYVDTFN